MQGERLIPLLRVLCLCLAGLLIYQCSGLFGRNDPLRNLRIPAALTPTARSTAPSPAAVPETGKATNAGPGQPSPTKNTNAPPAGPGALPPARPMMPGARQGPGMIDPNLPPAVRTRVERIVQSEILGPIIRPLPMALLGIGGNEAFLRAPNGQTGLVKEGDELGGVKLLRIGTNRVLIEHEGQKKELMIFSGLGSETLLSKEKESPK